MKDKQARRIEVMLEWRDVTAAAGHVVPSVADMMRIGATGDLWPPDVDLSVAMPWKDTFAHLLKQVKFGVVDPVGQMPDDLMVPDVVEPYPHGPGERVDQPPPTTPAAPAAERESPATEDHPVFMALRRWRQVEQEGNRAVQALKDTDLRRIVVTGSRSETEIRMLLPAGLRTFARRIAEIVAAAAPAVGVPSDVPRATESTMPSVPPPATASQSTAPPAAAPPSPRHVTFQPSHNIDPPDLPRPAETVDELSDLELADCYSPPAVPSATIRVKHAADGIDLRWPAAETGQPTVLYRVVSADRADAPYAPQDGVPVTVTEGLTHVDRRRFVAAVRHFQVWYHAGRTRAEAADVEPVLYAAGVAVGPVQDAHIAEDGPAVVGHWRVPAGSTRVQVLRIPHELADATGRGDLQYRILADQPNLKGFEDYGIERGHRYVYRVSVEAEVSGSSRLSAAVTADITVSAVLAPVTDLRVTPRPGEPDAFDLSWTPPAAGTLRIYRTKAGPAPGADERHNDEADLAKANLPLESWLRRPDTTGPDGRATMEKVPWPDDGGIKWTRAYFTPVTVLGGMAAVGQTVPWVRLGPVREAAIVERTYRQVLTFAWPAGADAVAAHEGLPGQDAESASQGESQMITLDEYKRQGGMHFARPLPPAGSSVHVRALAHSAGRTFHGPPVTLPYSGLTLLRYTVRTDRDRSQKPMAVVVQIFAKYDSPTPLPFTLVYHPERLPLHLGDGWPLESTPTGDPHAIGGIRFRPSHIPADPGQAAWTARVEGLSGYLRLFVCVEPAKLDTIALLDPPVGTLRLDPTPRRVER